MSNLCRQLFHELSLKLALFYVSNRQLPTYEKLESPKMTHPTVQSHDSFDDPPVNKSLIKANVAAESEPEILLFMFVILSHQI